MYTSINPGSCNIITAHRTLNIDTRSKAGRPPALPSDGGTAPAGSGRNCAEFLRHGFVIVFPPVSIGVSTGAKRLTLRWDFAAQEHGGQEGL